MTRRNELQTGYLNSRIPQYSGSAESVRAMPYIDFRHSASPLRQSQNDEWQNDYRMPGER